MQTIFSFLIGTNFKNWNENILIILGCIDLNLVLRIEQFTPFTTNSTPDDRRNFEKWKSLNRLSLVIIKHGILETIRGMVSEVITRPVSSLPKFRSVFQQKKQ